jgi:hydrogenase maturation protease
MRRLLVAGVGNIFCGDDGFGVEVVRRLSREELPEFVRVADFGIRGLHLAYDILDGRYDVTILVDALPRGQLPGTLYVFEPDLQTNNTPQPADAHAMDLASVFAMLRNLGGTPGRVLIVGCEPASIDDGIALTGDVERAAGEAVQLIRELIDRENQRGDFDVPGDSRTDRTTFSEY